MEAFDYQQLELPEIRAFPSHTARKLQELKPIGTVFSSSLLKFIVMKNFLMMLYGLMLSAAAIAQNGGAKIDVNVNKDAPGNIPWLWIIGGVVLVVLLVSLLGRSEKVVVKD